MTTCLPIHGRASRTAGSISVDAGARLRRSVGCRILHCMSTGIVILRRAMARQPRHDYVVANPRTGQPYSRVHISRCWRHAARECGLQDFTFHDLRHHGPTVAVNAGATTAVLQAMGGWKSAKMV